jgi:hypothetical protein
MCKERIEQLRNQIKASQQELTQLENKRLEAIKLDLEQRKLPYCYYEKHGDTVTYSIVTHTAVGRLFGHQFSCDRNDCLLSIECRVGLSLTLDGYESRYNEIPFRQFAAHWETAMEIMKILNDFITER